MDEELAATLTACIAADRRLDAFQPGVVGTAPVRIFCRDSGY